MPGRNGESANDFRGGKHHHGRVKAKLENGDFRVGSLLQDKGRKKDGGHDSVCLEIEQTQVVFFARVIPQPGQRDWRGGLESWYEEMIGGI